MSHEDLTPQQRQGIIAHEVGHTTPQRIMPEIIGIIPLNPGTTTAGLSTNALTIDGHPITNEDLTKHTVDITIRAAGDGTPTTVAPHQILIDGQEAHTFD